MQLKFLTRTMLVLVAGFFVTLCTLNANAQGIKDVLLVGKRTAFVSPDCPREISLIAKITSDGPIKGVTYQLMRSDGTRIGTRGSVAIDGTSTEITLSYGNSGPQPWTDAVFLRILTPVEISSNAVTLTCAPLKAVPREKGSLPVRPIPTVEAAPRTATLGPPVAAPRGRFRVTLTGFTVNNATVDDALQRDGRGDEVYALANVMELSTSASPRILSPESLLYGDTSANSDHRFVIRGGNAGNTGGFVSGNRYPAPGEEPERLPNSADNVQVRLIPMVLWDGFLISGERAVVILPTIWEDDDFRGEVRDVWSTQAGSWLRNFAASAAPLVSGNARRSLITRDVDVMTTAIHRNSFDRPIGIDGSAFNLAADPGLATFRPAVMFLTYDSALEAAASTANSSTRGRGVIEITYRDGTAYGPGSYTIFLLVERLP